MRSKQGQSDFGFRAMHSQHSHFRGKSQKPNFSNTGQIKEFLYEFDRSQHKKRMKNIHKMQESNIRGRNKGKVTLVFEQRTLNTIIYEKKLKNLT